MTRRPRREERGAVALLSALLAVVMFGIGAIVVDIGQAWAKRSLLQTSVDLAVMAAAVELDNPGPCNQEVVDTATEYLLTKAENTVTGQYALNLSGSFGDGNGFIQCTDWEVRLEAPASRVDYGLGRVVSDDDHLDVAAEATAAIRSPSQSSSLPMYAVDGCSSGARQLSDPPPGPPPSDAPPELSPAGTAEIRNLAITPAEAPTDSVENYPVTVTGQVKNPPAGMTGQVTFTNPADGTPVPAGAPVAFPTGPGFKNFTISVTTVPQQVLDVDGIWWVRIETASGAATDYSPSAESEPFIVGELLFCDGVVSGNFGTLRIARSDGATSTWLERNMIKGLEPLLQVNASSAVPCSPEDSKLAPVSPTDCIGTDPGFPNEAATAGLIQGSGPGYPGRLDQNTTPGCDRNGGDSRTGVSPGPQGRTLNDDMLTCFILDGRSIADLVAGVPDVLSADILRSPRFFMLPVIPVEASNGGSNEYPIVRFVPGFITDQPLSARQSAPGSPSPYNGVYFQSGHVEQLNVVLFDEAALPASAPPVGGEVDYTGSGTKVLVLVD